MIELPRSSYYFEPLGVTEEELDIMNWIDRTYTKYPFYGVRKMTEMFRQKGDNYNHKRIARLMQLMGIQALAPKRNLSKPDKDHQIFPYLLRNVAITKPNQVWSTDITYIPMYKSFAYLVAVMDWFSKYVLAWELSNSLDVHFCLTALDKALRTGKPEIFNTDQGSQFTSNVYVQRILDQQIKLSMDSKGRAFDNIFIERLWRNVKYEDVYLRDYQNIPDLYKGLKDYFYFYNHERFHQSLDYKVPIEVYRN